MIYFCDFPRVATTPIYFTIANIRIRSRVHDNTLNFYRLDQQLTNYYDLDNFVYGHLMFMYKSYGDRGGDKKNKFSPREGRIEYHWGKENIFARRQAITLYDLDMRFEMKKGNEGEQYISYDSNFMLGIMENLRNSTWSTYSSIGVVDREMNNLVTDNVVGNGKNESMLE